MEVRELMTREPFTVRPDTPVDEAARLLRHHDIGALPVVGHDDVLVGLIGRSELARHRLYEELTGAVLPAVPVLEMMRPRFHAVHHDAEVSTATGVMAATATRHIPVVDHDHQVVGMICVADVVEALSQADQALAREFDRMLQRLGHLLRSDPEAAGTWAPQPGAGALTTVGAVRAASTASAGSARVPGPRGR